MNALTDGSIAFVQIFGIIFLAGGLNALFCRKSMSAALNGVVESPALLWVWGFLNLLFGAIIVTFHSAWSSDWRVIITIVGWAGILKGVLLMFFPDSARTLYRTCNTPSILTTGGIVAVLLGLFLLYVGLAA